MIIIHQFSYLLNNIKYLHNYNIQYLSLLENILFNTSNL